MIIPTPNLPTSNYTFEKKLMGEMNINFSKTELCLCCNETINDGKCQNEMCEKFNNKLNYHEIEICYFIPLMDQLQRFLTGMPMILDVYCVYKQKECVDFVFI